MYCNYDIYYNDYKYCNKCRSARELITTMVISIVINVAVQAAKRANRPRICACLHTSDM